MIKIVPLKNISTEFEIMGPVLKYFVQVIPNGLIEHIFK
jgi:hypothetical protein